jgi:hypothetical protein
MKLQQHWLESKREKQLNNNIKGHQLFMINVRYYKISPATEPRSIRLFLFLSQIFYTQI